MPETLSTVRVDALRHLGDSTNTIWSNAEIDRYIQEGYDRLLLITEILWKRAYSDDVSGTATYTLPSDLLQVERVTWNWRRIDPVTQDELISYDKLYTTTSGPPKAYSLEADGLRTLRKWPVPSSTPTAGADTNNTRIEYFARGTALSADATGFDIPDRYVKYIRHFALYRALEREGDGQDIALAAHWKARYEAGVQRLLNRKLRSQSFRTIGFTEGYRRPDPRPRLPVEFGRVVRYP